MSIFNRVPNPFRRPRGDGADEPEVIRNVEVVGNVPIGGPPARRHPGVPGAAGAAGPARVDMRPRRMLSPVRLPAPTSGTARAPGLIRRSHPVDPYVVAGRRAALSFYDGPAEDEPTLAGLIEGAANALGAAFRGSPQHLAVTIRTAAARDAIVAAGDDLARIRELAVRPTQPPMADPGGIIAWETTTAFEMKIVAAEEALREARAEQTGANNEQTLVLTQLIDELVIEAGNAVRHFSRYIDAFNEARRAAGHVTIEPLPENFADQMVINVIRRRRSTIEDAGGLM